MIKQNDLSLDDIQIGQKAQFKVIITKSMIDRFADLSGDFNSLHMDESYSKNEGFEKRVCHGMFLASLFSRLIGMHLPGKNALYLSQSLKFISPCYVDDEISVEGTVLRKSLSSKIVTLKTIITKKPDVKIVIGEAKVMIRGTNIVKR